MFSDTARPPAVNLKAPVLVLLDPVALLIVIALVDVAPRFVTFCNVLVTARSIFALATAVPETYLSVRMPPLPSTVATVKITSLSGVVPPAKLSPNIVTVSPIA